MRTDCLAVITTVATLLLLVSPAHALIEADKEAMTEFRPSDGPVVVRWLVVAGTFLSIVAVLLLARLVAGLRKRSQRIMAGDASQLELPVGLCLLLTAILFAGALTIAIWMSAISVATVGIYDAVEEWGPIEGPQTVLWVMCVALALAAARFLPSREGRRALFLLSAGAMLAGARELDAHLLIHPRELGDWGTAFRINWWFKSTTPVLPRLVWGTFFLVVAAIGLYAVRFGTPALLGPGRRLRRLLPALGAVAGLFFTSFALDDLLRFRVRLHPARVAEETVELAAVWLFLGCVIWAIQTARMERDDEAVIPDRPAVTA